MLSFIAVRSAAAGGCPGSCHPSLQLSLVLLRMTAGPGLQLLSDSLAGLCGDQQLDEEEDLFRTADLFSSEGGSDGRI